MSVSCSKFIGYCIDITEEVEMLDGDSIDHWLSDLNNKNEKEFDEINFRPYYNRTGSLKDKITVLYDGMCGEYCKLLYVIDYDTDSYGEDSESWIQSINNLMKEVAVPFEIKKQIKEVYKTMFNKELDSTSSICTEYIAHYH